MLCNYLCGIIVFYKPTIKQIESIKLLAQFYNIVVVDNTPLIDLNIVQGSNDSLMYIALKENKGIAAAQNIGITEACKKEYKYVFFLDQDSEIEADFPLDMLDEYKRIQKCEGNVAALGPMIVNKETNAAYKNYESSKNCENGYFICPTIISSGTLLPLWAFKKVGMMDESLFIDLVDHEWCWRANRMGFVCCMTSNIKMIHKVGLSEKTFLSLSFLIAAPFRYFYQYRNFCWLLKRDYVPANWKVKNLMRSIITFFFIPWFSDEPIAVFRNMLAGIYAGLFKKGSH